MKNGNYALYKGKEYSADYIKGKGMVLRSGNIEDIKNGFQMYDGYNKKIICIKFVDKAEVESFYRLRTKAIYGGYEFEVLEEKDHSISIVSNGGDYRNWLNLGMKCIDKGVYQKWINKEDAEIGAWPDYWVPGGYTSGGVPEVVVDQIPF
ncbi:hypothetical protein [Lacrimispora sp.]|uniref:hypothetical protein n=1 Tax=Lacrimispora sp. TaxID=2719234 RepID=UPI002898798B|nr:hypothetical protein [Lacrimispora sp.]